MLTRSEISGRLESVVNHLSALSERSFVCLKVLITGLSLAVGMFALQAGVAEVYSSFFEAGKRLDILLADADKLQGDLKKIEVELVNKKGQGGLAAKSGLTADAEVVSVIDEAVKQSGIKLGGLNVINGAGNAKKHHKLDLSGGYKEITRFVQLLSESANSCRLSLSEVGIKSVGFKYPKERLEGWVLIRDEVSKAP